MVVTVGSNGVQDRTDAERMQQFSTWFRPHYERMGLGYRVLAERVGVSHPTIGRWLNGEPNMIQPDNCIKLAAVLGVEPIEVLVAAGYMPEIDDARQQLIQLIRYLPEGQIDTALQFIRFLIRG